MICGVSPTRVHNLALGVVEAHELHVNPVLKLVQVPWDGISSLSHVNCTIQLGVIRKLDEGALDPTMSLIKILKSTAPSMDP